MRWWHIITAIGIYLVLRMMNVDLPDSRELARASAFILLIMVLVAAVSMLGWGGGSKKNER
jgi:hypothetical protein